MMIRITYSLIILVLLTGCLPKESVRMPAELSNISSDNAGLVFGSIGVAPKSPFASVSLAFRKIGTSESGHFVFNHDNILGGSSLDIQENGTRATVFATLFPEGEYELFQVSFFINRAQFGTTTFSAKEEFSIPFSVKKNQSTYLGEFISYNTLGKNYFGMPIPSGGYYVVTDRLDRDSGIFATKPNANTQWGIKKSIVDIRAVNLPLFQPYPEGQ